MPRPQKLRKVCAVPRHSYFPPSSTQDESAAVELTVDEYETIHLIDLKGFTQEQCAKQMDVARSTVQTIYQSARIKLAICLVNGRALAVSGGGYQICEYSDSCRCQGCDRRSCDQPCSRDYQCKNGMANESAELMNGCASV